MRQLPQVASPEQVGRVAVRTGDVAIWIISTAIVLGGQRSADRHDRPRLSIELIVGISNNHMVQATEDVPHTQRPDAEHEIRNR